MESFSICINCFSFRLPDEVKSFVYTYYICLSVKFKQFYWILNEVFVKFNLCFILISRLVYTFIYLSKLK